MTQPTFIKHEQRLIKVQNRNVKLWLSIYQFRIPSKKQIEKDEKKT